jgi:hypothetical protein
MRQWSGFQAAHPKYIFSLSLNVRANFEESTCKAMRSGIETGCGYIERLQIEPAESAGSDVLHRHLHDTVDRSVRRDANDATAKESAIPKIAFGVHSGAIGQPACKTLEKRPLVCDRARRRIVVIDPDDVRERIGKIEVKMVRAPCNGI